MVGTGQKPFFDDDTKEKFLKILVDYGGVLKDALKLTYCSAKRQKGCTHQTLINARAADREFDRAVDKAMRQATQGFVLSSINQSRRILKKMADTWEEAANPPQQFDKDGNDITPKPVVDIQKGHIISRRLDEHYQIVGSAAININAENVEVDKISIDLKQLDDDALDKLLEQEAEAIEDGRGNQA